MGFPGDTDDKKSACNAGDLGSIPGLGRSPGGGHGNPLQYSCLENPHEWKSLAGYIHGLAKSQTWLSNYAQQATRIYYTTQETQAMVYTNYKWIRTWSELWPLRLWITKSYSSVKFTHSVVSDSLRPNGLQHARPPCPEPTPGDYPNSCPSSRWYHPTISSSADPSSPALNLSQHQGLFQWVSSSHQVAKVLEFQLQHQSFQWTPRTDLL